MENKTKIIIWVGVGVILAAGIGIAIYQATKKKLPPAGTGNGTGTTGTGTGKPPKDKKTPTEILNALIALAALIRTYTDEKFPLRPGMKGPNVKELQDSLRTKWNQLAVGSDGIFGVKTAKALREIGYGKSLVDGVTREDIDNIFDKKPLTT